MSLAALVMACAPQVDPSTVMRVIDVESARDALALSANFPDGPRRLPARTLDEAVAQAEAVIAAGVSVDVGLMQVNSANLSRMGVTVRDALDPCTNLRLGSEILAAAYDIARRRSGPGQRALQEALSRYNTGSAHRGFLNGYVGRYYTADTPRARQLTALMAAMTARSTAYVSP